MQTMATNGMTWDVIAYQQIGDEFQMDNIMAANAFELSDVVTFDGGEAITVPSVAVVDSQTIAAPWDD